MKPVLEQLRLDDNQKTINFFDIRLDRFEPYWHFHPEVELTLILKGSGIRYIGDSIMPFTSGDLVMIGPNLPHHWVSDNFESDGVHAIVLQFKPELFANIHVCKYFFRLFESAKYGLQFKTAAMLTEAFSSFGDKSRGNRLATLITILDFLAMTENKTRISAKEYFLSKDAKQKFARSEKITRYILENLNRRLTVQEVAELAHLTPQSFCRWFKKATGHSFINFVNISRIENASQLLLTRDSTVATIAFETGFESISQFNRAFKKHRNVTATEFRELHKNTLD